MYIYSFRLKKFDLLILLFLASFNFVKGQESVSSIFNISKKNLRDNINLTSVFFSDERNGWVSGQKKLYKTSDYGKTWKLIANKFPTQGIITKMFFQNARLGWIVLQKSADIANEENYFLLLHTEDGGKTWRKQHEEKDAIVRNIIFTNDNKGWIVGFRKKGLSSIGHQYLALFTENKGKNWIDLSIKINDIPNTDSENTDPKLSRNAIYDIAMGKDSSVIVFLNNGRVFKTLDNGKSWKKLFIYPKTRLYSVFRKFGVTENNRIWVLSGSDSVEGTLGEILFEKDNNEFSYKLLGNVNFNDAVYLSSNRFIVAGRSYNQNKINKEAVILYSDNNGEEWQSIYKTSEVSNVTALAKISNKSIWGVGEKGLIIHLQSADK